jgi:ParB/RepB/Spo0J family partition protein
MQSPVGTVQPVLIREGDYELIDGKHRLAAAKRAGLKFIECRTMKASNADAKIMALTVNVFGKRLNDLEIGKAVHDLLAPVKRRSGREKLKRQLAAELGMRSTSRLEDCLTTYQQMDPEVRSRISTAVERGTVKVDHLRHIRTLPPEKQLALTKQIAEVKDPSRVDRLISGFLAAQEPLSSQPRTSPQAQQTNLTVPACTEPEKFFTVFKFEMEGKVHSVEHDRILVDCNGNSLNIITELQENMQQMQTKLKPRDLVFVGLRVETPTKKKIKAIREEKPE